MVIHHHPSSGPLFQCPWMDLGDMKSNAGACQAGGIPLEAELFIPCTGACKLYLCEV